MALRLLERWAAPTGGRCLSVRCGRRAFGWRNRSGRAADGDNASEIRREVEPPTDHGGYAGLSGHGLLPQQPTRALVDRIDGAIAAGDVKHTGGERIGRSERAVFTETPAGHPADTVDGVDVAVVARCEDRRVTERPDDQLGTGGSRELPPVRARRRIDPEQDVGVGGVIETASRDDETTFDGQGRDLTRAQDLLPAANAARGVDRVDDSPL